MSNSKISKITISDVVYDLRDRATEENLGRLENSVETLGEDLSKLKTTVDNLRPTVLELNDEAVRKKDVDEVLNSDDNATNPIQNNTVSRAIDSLNDRISNLDIGGLEITVDSELNLESTNPVQNKVITNALNELEIVVDSELNEDSTNPVQNKVITEALKELEPDRDLDTSSMRPIQNGTVSYYIESINSNIESINSTIENDVVKNSQIDSSLSTGSTNPVQNKVITSKINELSDKIDGLSGSESSIVSTIVYDESSVSTGQIRKPKITTNIVMGGCYTVKVSTVFGYQVLNIPISLNYGEEAEIIVLADPDGLGSNYFFNIYDNSGTLQLSWSGDVKPGEFLSTMAEGYVEAPGAPLIENTVISGYKIEEGAMYRLRIKMYPEIVGGYGAFLLGTCESFN